ncbi:MAG: N-acetyl-gamma-glutamyl-phosphate reductase [Alphaproteobacteria bacterium]|nr:N-acetyl-gamma-glutamyl-phosphate reductase [Alphaproteobacteria bacterium]MBV9370091.1 N-acetyl-gamma-glutamyl-phosphate reductase [Alphaproteobacteria bacterium]MBV9901005.1 N-acetyl-gamma-glutamyl-phosphate reductase [Alphaproteobacteria bacterium]
MIRVAILGASGFVGAELLRLCAQHPDLEPAVLFGDSQAGRDLAAIHPHLALAYPDSTVERWSAGRLDGIDLVVSALPHGESQRLAAAILGSGARWVDLGADFRLRDPAAYERWYGEPHEAPELLERFAYGIPELGREAVASARAVAAAGCYPTSAILALKPLIDLIEPDSLVVDAASGVSGAGKGLKEETHFDTVDENFTAYGLLAHRHTAEMEMALGGRVLFTPHLAPMNRGILATCYGVARKSCNPLERLRDAYADEPFIHVSERPPSTKWTLGSNAVHLTARYDPRTGRVLAIAALDNLVKGAAGQMIQCANLMLGLEETAGLPRVGVWP